MFIKQLYHYNKYWLVVFLCFILAFIYINYKWGVVATPVYQYGMFGGSYAIKDTQLVYDVSINNEWVSPARFNFVQRDMIYYMTQKYEEQKRSQMQIYATLNRLYSKAGLGNMVSEAAYRNTATDKDFAQWLLQYIQKENDPAHLKVVVRKYQWQQGKMQAVSPIQNTGIDTY